ncbi:MAG: aminotransferase class III-fold pyridoxal phosphate-dependent enzyme, partial [Chromatiaceae bacterium]
MPLTSCWIGSITIFNECFTLHPAMTKADRKNPRYRRSLELFERAQSVIPGGIYGHVTPALLEPGDSPYYASRAEGCRYWDVDGNEYLDFLCGYGPVVLGHANPEVDEAAERVRRDGQCFNHPTSIMVELAERLVACIDFAGWAVFAKNGSDVATWCTQVAREATGRRKLLMAQGAYHGTASWCSPGHGGLIDEDRRQVLTFDWNDPQSVEDAFIQHGDDLAAVIVTPFHHPLFEGSSLPEEEFVHTVRDLCDHHGTLLILDDIRAGFRLHLGGSHRVFGWQPDLACYSKALGNGYPISAAAGKPGLKPAASKVFLTGSFWNSPVEMAASLKTIQLLENQGGIEVMRQRGEAFAAGLAGAAQRAGLSVRVTGPPALPFMHFE